MFKLVQVRINVSRWKDIGANEYIIDVIENGYKIPFLHIPDSIALDNNKSARDNTKFVTEEIDKLINKGCVSPVTEKPYVVNILSTFCQLEKFANGDMRFLNHIKIPNFLY
jgi:hypothetical protein